MIPWIGIHRILDPHIPDQYGRGPGFDFGDWPLPTGLETVTVESIDPDFGSLDWEIYHALEDGAQLAKVNVDASVILDGFIPHADYYAREDRVNGSSHWGDTDGHVPS
jgi:hypothetical protein